MLKFVMKSSHSKLTIHRGSVESMIGVFVGSMYILRHAYPKTKPTAGPKVLNEKA